MEQPPQVHVAGVAGVGMSALAQALLDAGYCVTGSDRYIDQGHDLDILKILRLAGVDLLPQDGRGIGPQTVALAVSTAIEPDNPDLLAAQHQRVPVVHRAAMLARLTTKHRLIAITGTAGKTTVTGLLGHLATEAGFDPVVVNGGLVNNWRSTSRVGSVRRGEGSLMIIEADESDRSLLAFHPHGVVITNVSKDHFELAEVTSLFNQFRARATGWSLLGPQAAAVLEGVTEPDLALTECNGERFINVEGHTYPLPMPGRHNAENVLVAVQAALKLGIAPDIITRGLATFRGIHRRLEVVARDHGLVVLDDYAHNPAKLAASWSAAAERAPRILGFWRPHGYAPLALLFDELVEALAGVIRPQDHFMMLPVYYAGGTTRKTNDAERLAEALVARGRAARHVPDYDALDQTLRALMQPGDTILGMGARDPQLPAYLHTLGSTLHARPMSNVHT